MFLGPGQSKLVKTWMYRDERGVEKEKKGGKEVYRRKKISGIKKMAACRNVYSNKEH